jgi:anti-sigma factor RsiW
MTHLDDDTLLKFHLEMLDPSDDSRVREHLSACRQCREREKKIQADVGRLSEIEMHLDEAAPPPLLRRARFFTVAARAAAMLAVGFLAGYMTAEVANPVPPNTVQQRLVPARIAAPPSGYFPCQAVDAGAGR